MQNEDRIPEPNIPRDELPTDLCPPATAFLHFLCTPCGHSGCPLYQIFPAILFHMYELAPSNGWNHVSFSSCPVRDNPQKSVAVFFLNCTKNTELTRAHFARKVTFALAKF